MARGDDGRVLSLMIRKVSREGFCRRCFQAEPKFGFPDPRMHQNPYEGQIRGCQFLEKFSNGKRDLVFQALLAADVKNMLVPGGLSQGRMQWDQEVIVPLEHEILIRFQPL